MSPPVSPWRSSCDDDEDDDDDEAAVRGEATLALPAAAPPTYCSSSPLPALSTLPTNVAWVKGEFRLEEDSAGDRLPDAVALLIPLGAALVC